MSIGLNRSVVSVRWQLFIAWLLAQRERHQKLKPLFRAELSQHDLMGQAELLMRAGYHIAGAMLLRSQAERMTLRLVMISPKWDQNKAAAYRSFSYNTHCLCEQGVIDRATRELAGNLWKSLSRIVHTGGTSKRAARSHLREAKVLRIRLEKAAADTLCRAQ